MHLFVLAIVSVPVIAYPYLSSYVLFLAVDAGSRCIPHLLFLLDVSLRESFSIWALIDDSSVFLRLLVNDVFVLSVNKMNGTFRFTFPWRRG